MLRNNNERARFLDYEANRQDGSYSRQQLEEAFNFIMDLSPIVEPYRGRREDRATIRTFTSGLISRYVSAASLRTGSDPGRSLVIDRDAEIEVAVLKGLTWHYVIDSRSLTAQRFGQRALVRSLFSILYDAARSKDDWHVFPENFQDAIAVADNDSERIARIVADLISSMAESQLIAMHQRLTGSSLGSAMDPIIS